MHPKQTIMSNFCLFNPEHEIALASNLMNFTAPKAGRMLRADLGFLPSSRSRHCCIFSESCSECFRG